MSKAPHLQKTEIPITVRFSNFPGVTTLPDTDKNSSPRGMSIKFHLPGALPSGIEAEDPMISVRCIVRAHGSIFSYLYVIPHEIDWDTIEDCEYKTDFIKAQRINHSTSDKLLQRRSLDDCGFCYKPHREKRIYTDREYDFKDPALSPGQPECQPLYFSR